MTVKAKMVVVEPVLLNSVKKDRSSRHGNGHDNENDVDAFVTCARLRVAIWV